MGCCSSDSTATSKSIQQTNIKPNPKSNKKLESQIQEFFDILDSNRKQTEKPPIHSAFSNTNTHSPPLPYGFLSSFSSLPSNGNSSRTRPKIVQKEEILQTPSPRRLPTSPESKLPSISPAADPSELRRAAYSMKLNEMESPKQKQEKQTFNQKLSLPKNIGDQSKKTPIIGRSNLDQIPPSLKLFSKNTNVHTPSIYEPLKANQSPNKLPPLKNITNKHKQNQNPNQSPQKQFQNFILDDKNQRSNLDKLNPLPRIEIPDDGENEINSIDFSDVDYKVSHIPQYYTNTLAGFCQYLVSLFSTEMERIRAICFWIAAHVKYDHEALEKNEYGDQSAEAVFRAGKGVCAGYANLVHKMCQHMGIESELLSGWSKAKGYKIGDDLSFKKKDHAWNGAKINGKWYLLDTTWMAKEEPEDYDSEQTHEEGQNNHQKNSQKENSDRVNEFYFLTPPEYFIFDHLPINDQWQLLQNKWTLEEFCNVLQVGGNFFKHGIRPEKYFYLVSCEKRALIKLYCSDPQIEISASVKNEGEKIKNLTKITRVVDGFELEVILPEPKKYEFEIYSRINNGEQTAKNVHYFHCITYLLEAFKGEGKDACFPFMSHDYQKYNVDIISPQYGLIRSKNGKVKVCLHNPYNVEFSSRVEQEDEKFPNLTKHKTRGTSEIVKAILPTPGKYTLVIFGRKASDNLSKHFEIFTFIVMEEVGCGRDRCYPLYFTIFPKYQNQIRPISHKNGLHRSNNGKLKVSFELKNLELLAKLTSSKEEKVKNAIKLKNYSNRGTIHALIPESGEYTLTIYGKEPHKEGSFDGLFSYKVIERVGRGTEACYPKFYGIYSDYYHEHIKIVSPKNGILRSSLGKIKLSIEVSSDYEIISHLLFEKHNLENNIKICLDNDSGYEIVEAVLPRKGKYKLAVFGKPKVEDGSYSSLFQFTIFESVGSGENQCFPKYYSKYGEYKHLVQLVSPKMGYIESINGTTQINLIVQDNVRISTKLTDQTDNQIQNSVLSSIVGNELSLAINLPKRGKYNLTIYAILKDSNQTYTDGLFSFTIFAQQGLGEDIYFPTYYNIYYDKYTSIKLLSPKNGLIKSSNGTASIELEVPSNILLFSELKESDSGKIEKNRSKESRRGNKATITCLLPSPKKYSLIIYAKFGKDKDALYDSIFGFDIMNAKGNPHSSFPHEYPFLQECGSIIYPENGTIFAQQAKSSIYIEKQSNIELFACLASENNVEVENSVQIVNLSPEKVKIISFVPRQRKEYTLSIYAKNIQKANSQNQSYTSILSYKILSNESIPADLKFPTIYKHANQILGLELLTADKIISQNGKTIIEFLMKSSHNLEMRLNDDYNELPNQFFLEKDEDKYRIHLSFPKSGEYSFTVYENIYGQSISMFKYQITSLKGNSKLYVHINEIPGVQLLKPICSTILSGKNYKFKIKSNQIEDAILKFSAYDSIQLHKIRNVWEADICVPDSERFTTSILMLKISGNSSYSSYSQWNIK